MSKITLNQVFVAGVVIGILFFIAADIYSYYANPFSITSCDDCYRSYGFPFVRYESGTILHLDNVLWFGLIGNILTVLISSFILGLIFKFVWSKIAVRKSK